MSRFSERKRRRREQRKAKGLRMVREEKRVAILVPSDDRVNTHFCVSLQKMTQHTILQQPDGLAGLSCQFFGSTILPFSRQQLAEYAISVGATHALWIDSDRSFPEDMLIRFLTRDEPVIGINAMSRRVPFRCTAQGQPEVPLVTRPESTGLEKVHRMGFGVLWTATSVFREMPKPWFDFDWVPEKGCWRGEDFSFFERAREKGHEFYVDHDLSKQVKHHGDFGYNPLILHTVEAQQAQG